MGDIIITYHAADRIHERIGKKIKPEIVKRAYEDGIMHKETKGTLNKYIASLYFHSQLCNNIRIYNYNVFLFAGSTLITVIPLPNKFKPHVDSIKKRKASQE